MNARELLDYYSDDKVLEQLFSYAQNREISVALAEGGHMRRPQSITYRRDIVELAKRGGVSFHGTVEHWTNPMLIKTGMRPEELDAIRTGWDVVIDIDSSIGLEASKLAAGRVLDFLHSHGVKAGVKFSGNRGFHIGVPWSSLPEEVDYAATATQFPKLPRTIATFIKESIKDELFQDLKRMKGSIHDLIEELGETNVTTLSPYMFVDIENNWGERHLFRLPYSINEKSWKVSLPLSPKELQSFRAEHASPERVLRYEPTPFLPEDGKADALVVAAVDWHASRTKEARKVEKKPRPRLAKEIPETMFPPCIKLVMGGLPDGRKRSLLVLINFLQQMGWTWERIEATVRETNARNKPPLPENYVNTQLSWFRRGVESGRALLPPNCANEAFYKSYGICQPDERCKRGTSEIQIKNPVSYPFQRAARKR